MITDLSVKHVVLRDSKGENTMLTERKREKQRERERGREGKKTKH